MNHNLRLSYIQDILNCIADEGTPIEYDNNPLTTLIVIADSVATLCRNIKTATQLPSSPHPQSHFAQDIYDEATKITGLGLAELHNMNKSTKRDGMTPILEQAAYHIKSTHATGNLDLYINPADRIALLIEALGNAAPYWPHPHTLKKADLLNREETIATLAYHAVCAIIATNDQRIAN